jgi:predicted DNA-binding ribbon-helix-helix protein
MASLATGGAIVTVSRLVNRNVIAERGRTSMRLEPELWEALLEICDREGQDMSSLVRKVEQNGHAGGRTSAVRVFVMSYFRDAATEAGHSEAGHGTASTVRHSEPESRHVISGATGQRDGSPAAPYPAEITFPAA